MWLLRFISALGLATTGIVGLAPTAQAASGPWLAVSAGSVNTCAINTSRNLFCWGYNGDGEIGDGTTTDRLTPRQIGASGAWAKVATGDGSSCAITTGRDLYCWGWNSSGEVGDGTTVSRLTPKRISGAGVWQTVTADGRHACGTTTARNLYCWGNNGYGELGDGTRIDRTTPKRISAAGIWITVDAGSEHTCAVNTSRNIYCWGANGTQYDEGYSGDGRLGDGTAATRVTPTRIASYAGVWAQVSAGGSHTCALSTSKSLFCWGSGGLGDGTTKASYKPKKISTSGIWAAVSAGGSHTCAVSTSKSLFCWGSNSEGQIGDGTHSDFRAQLTPKKIGYSGVWITPSAGTSHTCGLRTGGIVNCWGWNQSGAIGDGTRVSPRTSPRLVA